MKITFKNIEFFAVILLFLAGLYIWTLPIQTNPYPFGDVDASSHFTIGDYIVSGDKSIKEIPYPVTFRYYGQNNLLPSYLWYPPQFWVNTGIAQILGGQRIFPVFVYIAISGLLIILTSYILIRNLFGFWPAFLSSLLLIFSARDYMIYLWGQWPQSMSYALTPLVIYSFYAYYKSLKEDNQKPIYIYLAGILMAGQFFFHPQGMIASIATMAVFCLIISIKNRKLPFKIKHILIGIVLLALVAGLLAPFNVGEFFFEMTHGGESGAGKGIQLDKLFDWYHVKKDAGLPDFYFAFKNVHGSLVPLDLSKGLWRIFGENLLYWTLPLISIGIIFLLMRRKDEDYILIGWLVSYYFLTRLTVIGMGSRDIRMFAFEAHIFYPLAALGILSLPSFFKGEKLRTYLKFGAIGIFIFLTIYVNGNSAYTVLKQQSNSIGRINTYQLESAEWMMKNLPEKADILDIGTVGFQDYSAKIKWLMALSQRHFIINDYEKNGTDYVYFDYSDGILLRNQQYVDGIKSMEQQFANNTVIYDKNYIKIYKVENGLQI